MRELASCLAMLLSNGVGRLAPIVATTYRHCAVSAAVTSVQEAGIGVGYREIAGLMRPAHYVPMARSKRLRIITRIQLTCIRALALARP
jgi:hypothetical protein